MQPRKSPSRTISGSLTEDDQPHLNDFGMFGQIFSMEEDNPSTVGRQESCSPPVGRLRQYTRKQNTGREQLEFPGMFIHGFRDGHVEFEIPGVLEDSLKPTDSIELKFNLFTPKPAPSNMENDSYQNSFSNRFFNSSMAASNSEYANREETLPGDSHNTPSDYHFLPQVFVPTLATQRIDATSFGTTPSGLHSTTPSELHNSPHGFPHCEHDKSPFSGTNPNSTDSGLNSHQDRQSEHAANPRFFHF